MQNPPREVIIVYFASIIFWMLVVGVIWLSGQRWERVRAFRNRMQEQWRIALLITVVYMASAFLSGHGINPYGPAIFCQAILGLAIAESISDFEPIPVIQSILRRDQVMNRLVLFVIIGLIAGAFGMAFGSMGMDIARSIFHETIYTSEAMQEFPVNKFQAFFMFLAGAGIAEETTYRLLLLSLLWTLTKQRWFAIIASALFFGAYHLTPLNGMYLTFLKFPISQFVASTFIGTVWGYVFVKRGYETAVLAHTISDWFPVLLFM